MNFVQTKSLLKYFWWTSAGKIYFNQFFCPYLGLPTQERMQQIHWYIIIQICLGSVGSIYFTYGLRYWKYPSLNFKILHFLASPSRLIKSINFEAFRKGTCVYDAWRMTGLMAKGRGFIIAIESTSESF